MFQRCRMPAPASPAATTAVRAAVTTTPVDATAAPATTAAVPAQIPATLATDEAGRAFT
ncbi:hypothetical protein [Kitasatospora sp. NPDC001547]|uniref:hypothetical protein n=1 Tax=Kitasatospora sp. NPDC001547 TaxID=3364015 RepID=UPI0036A522D6|nr:hypothetical protein KitaXyl93_60010 [Kitasatospora sp. Xyl93]